MLKVYAGIVLMIFFLTSGARLSATASEGEISYITINTVLMIPIFGRILGWW